jgi:solute carrier family 6 (neurotransmitter transporter, amino acid/orphan) member 15/16/17/18/20
MAWLVYFYSHFTGRCIYFMDPGVAICRLFGIVIVEDSDPMPFPADELRDVNGIVPHEPTEFEQLVFFFRPDGSEGMCWPTLNPNPERVLQEDE